MLALDLVRRAFAHTYLPKHDPNAKRKFGVTFERLKKISKKKHNRRAKANSRFFVVVIPPSLPLDVDILISISLLLLRLLEKKEMHIIHLNRCKCQTYIKKCGIQIGGEQYIILCTIFPMVIE